MASSVADHSIERHSGSKLRSGPVYRTDIPSVVYVGSESTNPLSIHTTKKPKRLFRAIGGGQQRMSSSCNSWKTGRQVSVPYNVFFWVWARCIYPFFEGRSL